MSTLKGIFEPFRPYVQKQLKVRKMIMMNPIPVEGIGADSINTPYFIEFFDGGSTDLTEGFSLSQRSNIFSEDTFFGYTTEKQCVIRMMSGVDLRVGDLSANFLKKEGADPDLKYLQNDPAGLAKQYVLEGGTQFYREIELKDETGAPLAGGDRFKQWGGLREGLPPDNLKDMDGNPTNSDPSRAFSYGDKHIRSDADDDFGMVPMPGIKDAEIRTKSDNGALREAKVNFICHNRRQLEILEMLYMRPGYPICLEWGWDPYIDNEGIKRKNEFSIRDEFFSEAQTLETLNEQIRKYKEATGGNFDGFIGYCKNFTFKANKFGGYECTTEIMAHGEIIESLKSQKTHNEFKDVNGNLTVDIQDSLLFYLRSIKYTFRSPKDIMFLNDYHTPALDNLGYPIAGEHHNYVDIDETEGLPTWDDMRTELGYSGTGCPSWYRGNDLIGISYLHIEYFTCMYENNVSVRVFVDAEELLKNNEYTAFSPVAYEASYNKPERKLQTIDYKSFTYEQYEDTFRNGEDKSDMMSEGAFYGLMGAYEMFPSTLSGKFFTNLGGFFENGKWGVQAELLVRNATPIQGPVESFDRKQQIEIIETFQSNLKNIDSKLQSFKAGYLDIIHLYQHINKEEFSTAIDSSDLPVVDADGNPAAGVGLESFLGGSIIKQTVKNDSTNASSGYKKNVYVRWDLLCQMINHLSTYKSVRYSDIDKPTTDKKTKEAFFDKFRLKSPQMELTYMNANRKTWNNKPRNLHQGKVIRESQNDSFYLPYTAPRVTSTDPIRAYEIPLEKPGLQLRWNPDLGVVNEEPELNGLQYSYNGTVVTAGSNDNPALPFNTVVTTPVWVPDPEGTSGTWFSFTGTGADPNSLVYPWEAPVDTLDINNELHFVYDSQVVWNQWNEDEPNYFNQNQLTSNIGNVESDSLIFQPIKYRLPTEAEWEFFHNHQPWDFWDGSGQNQGDGPYFDFTNPLGFNFGSYVNNNLNLTTENPWENTYNWMDHQAGLNNAITPTKVVNLETEDYHPLIGASLDESICLMPHQGIFDSLFDLDADGKGSVSYDKELWNSYDRNEEEMVTTKVNFRDISSYASGDSVTNIHDKNVRHSIGYVYFNLDFVIKCYEDIRLKDYVTNNDNSFFALNDKFNIYDFVKALWDGVNVATGH